MPAAVRAKSCREICTQLLCLFCKANVVISASERLCSRAKGAGVSAGFALLHFGMAVGISQSTSFLMQQRELWVWRQLLICRCTWCRQHTTTQIPCLFDPFVVPEPIVRPCCGAQTLSGAMAWGKARAKSERKSDFQKSANLFVKEMRSERLEGSKRSRTTLLL
eukprot:3413284-Rhodomonas_salina.1